MDKFGLLGQVTGHQISILALEGDLKGIYLSFILILQNFSLKRFIKFEMPTEDERYELIHTIAISNKINLEPKEDGLRAISRKTDGFSHRDMRNLMEKAFQVGMAMLQIF